MLRHFLTVACAVLLVGLANAAAAKRVALIIGNSNYENAPILPNPSRDATDLARAFEGLGYEVRLLQDATRAQLLDALRMFRFDSLGAEHSVIYYAGHGVEIDRQNFVIPIDAELKADIDVEYEAVPLELLVSATSGAEDLQLVVLDACRDNPFLEQMTRTIATRSIGRGLALYEPRGNSLVAYAAKEGTVALDGQGENSPYASAFLEALEKGDLEIGQFFREVRDSVIRRTNGQQEPFLYGSLSADPVFFKPQADVPPAPPSNEPAAGLPPQPGPSSDTRLAIDLAFWESIRSSTQARDFSDYLERFPDGQFRPLAERRLAALQRPDEPSRSSVAPSEVPEPSGPDVAADAEEIRLSRSEVRDLQARLNILGFGAGSEDGILGRRTSGAVAGFRRDRGLGGGSRIDRRLLDRLAEEVSVSRLAAYRERSRPAAPAPAPQSSASTPTQKAAPAAPKPTGNFSGFAGRTFCRQRAGLVENGRSFSDRPIRCYTILNVNASQVTYRVTTRLEYGKPVATSTFTRSRSGDRSFSPIAFPPSGTGYILAPPGNSTYVPSRIYR